MKRILFYLSLIIPGIVSAQNVTIPDSSFKQMLLDAETYNYTAVNSSGNGMAIDVNNDNEIQVSEANAVWELNLGSNYTIASLEGIASFVNLRKLTVVSPPLTTLDVSMLTHLEELNCGHAGLTLLNISGLLNLKKLDCSFCHLTSLDLSGLTSLEEVNCGTNYNSIATPVTNLTSLNVSGLVNLKTLRCDSNQISVLDLAGMSHLEVLSCMFNEIAVLDVSSLASLKSINAQYNNIATNLDFSNDPNLETVFISENQIPSIQIADKANLSTLYCDENQIGVLYLGAMPSLISLVCTENNLTSIDVSSCPQLDVLSAAGNPLTYINIKNGDTGMQSFTAANFSDDETDPYQQVYICVDEGEQAMVTTYFAGYNLQGYINVSTYCSFTPGGNYNIISGTLNFDSNGNGCDSADVLNGFLQVNINDGTTQGTTYTNNGNYRFNTAAGNFTVTPQFENNWFTANPSSAVINLATADSTVVNNYNFCITSNGVHPDAEIIITPIMGAQPGFDTGYRIAYKNKGNQTLSGSVSFTYNSSVEEYISADPIEDSNTPGTLVWNYTNLLPFEDRVIYVYLNLNSPTDTPPVNLNDVLLYTAAITPTSGDESPADNAFNFSQVVVGSFDPNDITCLEGGVVNPGMIGKYLHYNINFENTGTAPATFIVVKDIIDTAKYDISSLELINASHNVEVRVTGNKAEFIFDNINLDGGEKGNVAFKIKTLSSVAVNSSVTQNADIFFDYNFPIQTNDATTVFDILGTDNFELDNSVKVYPNPAVSVVTIQSESLLKSVELFDVQGRLLQAGTTATVDVSGRASGIYFLKVTTERGTKVEKIVKN